MIIPDAALIGFATGIIGFLVGGLLVFLGKFLGWCKGFINDEEFEHNYFVYLIMAKIVKADYRAKSSAWYDRRDKDWYTPGKPTIPFPSEGVVVIALALMGFGPMVLGLAIFVWPLALLLTIFAAILLLIRRKKRLNKAKLEA